MENKKVDIIGKKYSLMASNMAVCSVLTAKRVDL